MGVKSQLLVLCLGLSLGLGAICQVEAKEAATAGVLQEAAASRAKLAALLGKRPEAKNAAQRKTSTSLEKGEAIAKAKYVKRRTLKKASLDSIYRQERSRALLVRDVEALNFDYAVYGNASGLNTGHIFDDGEYTYIDLTPALLKKQPRILGQQADDSISHPDYAAIDRFIRLEGIFKAIRITTGTRKCEILNKSFYPGNF